MAEVIRLPTSYEGPDTLEWERPVRKSAIAALLGVSTRTVDRWVDRGMPRDVCWIQVGAHRRFFPSQVRAWLRGG